MLIVPIPWNGKLKVLVVLEDENVERIKQHDCADVVWSQLPQAHLQPDTITIGYASPEEIKRIYAFAQQGNPAEAIKLVTGGFKYRPEAGDGDAPISINRKANHPL